MLYTVRPLERIYTDFRSSDKDNIREKGTAGERSEEFKEVMLPHGRVVTRRDGKDYIVERINSTDMKDYLNNEVSPGSIFKE